jgi:hypothetical protein
MQAERIFPPLRLFVDLCCERGISGTLVPLRSFKQATGEQSATSLLLRDCERLGIQSSAGIPGMSPVRPFWKRERRRAGGKMEPDEDFGCVESLPLFQQWSCDAFCDCKDGIFAPGPAPVDCSLVQITGQFPCFRGSCEVTALFAELGDLDPILSFDEQLVCNVRGADTEQQLHCSLWRQLVSDGPCPGGVASLQETSQERALVTRSAITSCCIRVGVMGLEQLRRVLMPALTLEQPGDVVPLAGLTKRGSGAFGPSSSFQGDGRACLVAQRTPERGQGEMNASSRLLTGGIGIRRLLPSGAQERRENTPTQ